MPTLRFFRLITPAVFVAALLATLALLAGSEAAAEPLVCASARYKLQGEDPEQPINNCYGPTPWQGGVTATECETDSGTPVEQYCYRVKVTLPV